jgi:hypothetical protein
MTDADLFFQTTIGQIQSAFLSTNTAKSMCLAAREAILECAWKEAIRHLSEAVEQLESAKSKIQAQL